MMTKNLILDELRTTRERLLAESGGTVSGLLDRLRADQAASERPTYESANNKAMQTEPGLQDCTSRTPIGPAR